jgi:hypothetical protein
MDCTTIGASEPTRTPPTIAVTVFLRGIIAIGISILTRKIGAFQARRPCLPSIDQVRQENVPEINEGADVGSL